MEAMTAACWSERGARIDELRREHNSREPSIDLGRAMVVAEHGRDADGAAEQLRVGIERARIGWLQQSHVFVGSRPVGSR